MFFPLLLLGRRAELRLATPAPPSPASLSSARPNDPEARLPPMRVTYGAGSSGVSSRRTGPLPFLPAGGSIGSADPQTSMDKRWLLLPLVLLLMLAALRWSQQREEPFRVSGFLEADE